MLKEKLSEITSTVKYVNIVLFEERTLTKYSSAQSEQVI